MTYSKLNVHQDCKKSKDDTRLNAFLHIQARAGYYSIPKTSANLVNEIRWIIDLCRWIQSAALGRPALADFDIMASRMVTVPWEVMGIQQATNKI